MNLTTLRLKAVAALTPPTELEYLIAKNQALGVKIDNIREERRKLKVRIDQLLEEQHRRNNGWTGE